MKWNIFGKKDNSLLIDLSKYMDIVNNELLGSELILVDNNEMIYIYKKECEIPQFRMYFTQYYFRQQPDAPLQKLDKEPLLDTYKNASCFFELQLFINSKNVVQLNEFGHLRLFDIINSHADRKAYQLLKYETFLLKSS